MRRALTIGLTGFALLALAAPAALGGHAHQRELVGLCRPPLGREVPQGLRVLDPAERHVHARVTDLLGVLGRVGRLQPELELTRADRHRGRLHARRDAVRSTAWYELVPAGSRAIHIAVQPGDAMSASVVVVGHRVTVELRDVTRHRSFVKTLHARTVDVTSAEWIAEAPSECVSDGACETLPLADFGTATFNSRARRRRPRARSGRSPATAWDFTKLRLLPGGRRFVVATNGGVPVGQSKPSALSAQRIAVQRQLLGRSS